MTYKMALNQNDFDVTDIAMSGEDAVAIAEKSSPDVALIDIILPGKMNGIEAVREIGKRLDIPFIHITENTDDCTKKEAMEAGTLDYLEKPVDMERLITLLNDLKH